MNIAFAYESVLPARGGCEHYISDLARRLVADRHMVHLYATRWDASSLPEETVYHAIPKQSGPRFLKPWKFAKAVLDSMQQHQHDVTVGFDKTYGQDLLYPQGGLHAASAKHNIWKHPSGLPRILAKWIKMIDPAHHSFLRLERRQYLTKPRPVIVVNSLMVQRHFQELYQIPESDVHIIPSAIDPHRFENTNRHQLREKQRSIWQVNDSVPIGLFVGMNYRLKGLAPLIQAVATIPADVSFKIAVVGAAKNERYRQLAVQLGQQDRFLFEGFRADPKDCFFAADFLVHPTFYDPCSLVVLEALSCGLPVITSRYNGAAELFPANAAGYVIQDPHDAKELGDSIRKLLDHSRLREFSQQAVFAGQKWNFEKHYQQLMKLFESISKVKANSHVI